MTVKRSHLSLEYLKYPVRAKVNGASADPTNDTVQFSFPVRGAAPSSWVAASWETDGEGNHYARCLVGPSGAFAPAALQLYDVWIKITDSTEVPARKIDLFITT